MAYELPEEYLEYLKQNVNWLEAFGDKFSGIDERIDYAVQQLSSIQQILTPEALVTIQKLASLLEELKESGFVMPERTEQISFRQALAPLQGIRLQEVVPINGVVTSISLHFPLGCAALVDIAIGYQTRQILPIEGFVALDNATPVYPIRERVKKDELFWCVMNNADALNPHTPAVAITISED